jgi:1-acyl-sn-glycerol-3-phosphate acyltransferase
MNAPSISLPILWFFRRIVRSYFHRHFHGVRVSGAAQFANNGRPLIVYGNHSSWWDPMVSILLADGLMPERSHYAPMDAEALARYRILQKVGIFPIEIKTTRGAVHFLSIGETILERGGVLWVTPQGQFVDSQIKPLVFKPGLAALAVRVAAAKGDCTVLPLAIEYLFWDERLPEVVLRFGTPVRVVGGETPDAVHMQLISALDSTMNQLRQLAAARDAGAFTTLLRGKLGVGGFYAFGNRLRALVSRHPYQPEHTVAREDTHDRTSYDA